MARKSSGADGLASHCLELFEPLGGVSKRLVFGEHAFFHDGAMFALIWEDALYVRVDGATRVRHEALGLKPFVYPHRDGRTTAMPYFQVPPAALEDPVEMEEWARPAIRAAHAASLEKASRTRAKGQSSARAKAKAARNPRPKGSK